MGKESRYERIYQQIKELTTKIDSTLSRMATINALLHYKMDNFFWTGFYLLQNDQLLVGPYQGPLACLTLEKHTGVCWTAIFKKKTIVVKNVNEFPGHIACDSRSKSEIALPLFDQKGNVTGVLDIDSDQYENFNEVDARHLEQITTLVYD